MQARIAIRLGFVGEAWSILNAVSDGGATRDDAERLNLLGVISEARLQWKAARRLYGRAIRADRHYAPAQQNMRRLYELHTFGRSAEPVALGDERPALAELLRAEQQG